MFADREAACDPDTPSPLVWFASFQDLLGTTAEGEVKDHNVDLHLIDWDCIVLDEYHFGAWQGAAKEVCSPAPAGPVKDPDKTEEKDAETAAEHAEEVADLAEAGTPRLIAATPESGITADLDSADLRLTGRHFLYLSGTPFRALTEGEFNEDAIYNWTYPDEQFAKQQWDADKARDSRRNPYRELRRCRCSPMRCPKLRQRPSTMGWTAFSTFQASSRPGRSGPSTTSPIRNGSTSSSTCSVAG